MKHWTKKILCASSNPDNFDQPHRHHRSFDRDVRKLDFSDEHGRRLDHRQERVVEEGVVVGGVLDVVVDAGVRLVSVEHDVEPEGESENEEEVPEKVTQLVVKFSYGYKYWCQHLY